MIPKNVIKMPQTGRNEEVEKLKKMVVNIALGVLNMPEYLRKQIEYSYGALTLSFYIPIESEINLEQLQRIYDILCFIDEECSISILPEKIAVKIHANTKE